jgi:hypothetical protein
MWLGRGRGTHRRNSGRRTRAGTTTWRPGDEKHIFASLRRLTKPLLLLLVATQLLLGVPAMASVHHARHEGANPACAGMQMAKAQHCPCCPDGVDSMKDCLAACTLGAAATPTLVVAVITTSPDVPFFEPARPRDISSDPPLKPPPIG